MRPAFSRQPSDPLSSALCQLLAACCFPPPSASRTRLWLAAAFVKNKVSLRHSRYDKETCGCFQRWAGFLMATFRP
jgi:hypothetical protein